MDRRPARRFTAEGMARHTLSFDVGSAWTSDDLVTGGSVDYLGSLAGLSYAWKISKTARLGLRFTFVPSIDDSSDRRLASETTLEAAVSAKLAVKLGYTDLLDNVPVSGFKKADTKSAPSLVLKLLSRRRVSAATSPPRERASPSSVRGSSC